jgi:hypothetical protein
MYVYIYKFARDVLVWDKDCRVRGGALLVTSTQRLRVDGRLTSCVNAVKEGPQGRDGPIGGQRTSKPWAALVRRVNSSRVAEA